MQDEDDSDDLDVLLNEAEALTPAPTSTVVPPRAAEAAAAQDHPPRRPPPAELADDTASRAAGAACGPRPGGSISTVDGASRADQTDLRGDATPARPCRAPAPAGPSGATPSASGTSHYRRPKASINRTPSEHLPAGPAPASARPQPAAAPSVDMSLEELSQIRIEPKRRKMSRDQMRTFALGAKYESLARCSHTSTRPNHTINPNRRPSDGPVAGSQPSRLHCRGAPPRTRGALEHGASACRPRVTLPPQGSWGCFIWHSSDSRFSSRTLLRPDLVTWLTHSPLSNL
jgi:hypothetical protein